MRYLLLLLAGLSAGASTVTITDYLGRSWERHLVHERLSFPPGELPSAVATVTEGSQVLTSQISDASYHADGSVAAMSVWWQVSLQPNESKTYTIEPGKGSNRQGDLVKTSDDAYHLLAADGHIRLPRGEQLYTWPVAASEAPAPILGIDLPGGASLPAGRLQVPFKVKTWEAELTEDGPLFAEVTVRYTFDVGYWHFTVRAQADSPMFTIREDLDTGFNEQPWDEVDRFFQLDFTGGAFQPGQVWYGCTNNDRPELETLLSKGTPEIIETVKIRNNWFSNRVYGFEVSPELDGDLYYMSGYPSVIARIGCDFRVAQPGGAAIGFAALDLPYWKHVTSLRLRSTEGKLQLSLPLQMYKQEWSVDGYGLGTPNYTGKTLYVPDTTIRRAWGLMLSPAQQETENLLLDLTAEASKLGALPLEKVRHWQFDIPDPMADADWAETTGEKAAETLQVMRDRIELRRLLGNYAEFSMAYHYGYAKSRFNRIKDAIDDPAQLSAADRAEMRRLAIFRAYDMNSMATFPWGTGAHLNNPNMSIMAVEARVKSSTLVQDHPMFETWGKWSLAFMKDYIRRFTRESGALYENVHYSLGVTLEWAAEANAILMEAGIGDAFDTELFKRSMRFTMDWLSPPDPRFKGHRTVLPFGNSSYQSVPPDFANAFVGYYQDRDADLAGKLQWVANQTLPEDKQVNLVPSVRPELGSVHYEDYGVYFRHGFGTPYETLFFMLAGNCDGHYEWETDQMSYTLYAKGQPINMHFGNGYFPMFCRPWLRNRVTIDHQIEKSERNPTRVLAASFMPETEYLRAQRSIDMIRPLESEYPILTDNGRWAPEEGQKNWPAVLDWNQIPMVHWFRQVMFVKDADPKGPNYFVLRDDFGGTPTLPADLSLWFLSYGMEQDGNLLHFPGQADVDMDVFVHTPVEADVETGEYGHKQHPYVRHVGWDPAYHPEGKLQETQTFMRLKQPPGKPFMVVLYPRLKELDPPARFERLNDVTVLVETPLSTDITLLSPHQATYQDDHLTMTGLGGTVRTYKDGRITVTNSEGPGYYEVAGKTISGDGSFVVTIHNGTATTDNEGVTIE